MNYFYKGRSCKKFETGAAWNLSVLLVWYESSSSSLALGHSEKICIRRLKEINR